MFKIFTTISVFLALIIIPGCIDMPKDLIMPEWDVDLNLPIASKSYILDDIIKSKNSLISINPSDSLYLLKSDEYSQSVRVAELITLKTESSSLDNDIPVNTSTDIYVAFPEGAKLKKAVFESGKLKIVGRNPSAGPVTLSMTIPGVKKNNVVYTLQLNLPANGNVPVTVEKDLTGWSYEQPASQPFLFDGQMWFQVTATGNGLGGKFDISSSNFEFNSVTGYFPRRALSSRRNSFDLNIGKDADAYRGKLFLQEASLYLKGKYISETGSPFQIKVSNFKVVGIRKNGEQKQLHFNDFSDSTWVFNNVNSIELQYDQNNSNILQFIEFIPDSVVINGDYILNPNDITDDRTVNSSDSVSFSARFESKNIIAIKQATLQNTENIDFKKEDRDQIVDGQGASLTYEIESKLPLNVWIKVMLLDENKHPLFAITGTTGNGLDSLLINSAQVNNGLTKNTITLSADQINKFSHAYYTDISVTMETSNFTQNNPPKFAIHANDWIKLKTYGSIKYRVKEKK